MPSPGFSVMGAAGWVGETSGKSRPNCIRHFGQGPLSGSGAPHREQVRASDMVISKAGLGQRVKRICYPRPFVHIDESASAVSVSLSTKGFGTMSYRKSAGE